MASDISTGGSGVDGGTDAAGRLSRMSSRTSLMVIDATLAALPRIDRGYGSAHAEVSVIAQRMLRATHDFAATLGTVG